MEHCDLTGEELLALGAAVIHGNADQLRQAGRGATKEQARDLETALRSIPKDQRRTVAFQIAREVKYNILKVKIFQLSS